MSDLAAYLAAAVLSGLAAYRLSTRQDASAYLIRRYGCSLLICLALAMALLAPTTPRLLVGLGADGTVVILSGDAVRTAAISLLMLMVRSLERRPVRGVPLYAAILAQTAMIGLFLAARPALAADGSVLVAGVGRWPLAARALLFAGYTEWTVAVAACALCRESRRVGAGQLRVGIRLVLAACAVGAVWAAWSADDVVDVLRSGVEDGSEDLISNALGALCACLIGAGALVVKWHGPLTAARARCRAYGAYRRLTPLWEALRSELPQLALADGSRRPLCDPDFALYRRVIEIHDGRLALRPYASERSVVADCLDRTCRDVNRGTERQTLLEAASIAVALDNHRAGRGSAVRVAGREADARSTARDSAATSGASGTAAGTVSGTMAEEAAWLVSVSAAFVRLRASTLLADMYPDS